jgi:hypothetical protein
MGPRTAPGRCVSERSGARSTPKRGLRDDRPRSHVCAFGGIGGAGRAAAAAGRAAAHAPHGGPGAPGRPGGLDVRAHVGRLPGPGARGRRRARLAAATGSTWPAGSPRWPGGGSPRRPRRRARRRGGGRRPRGPAQLRGLQQRLAARGRPTPRRRRHLPGLRSPVAGRPAAGGPGAGRRRLADGGRRSPARAPPCWPRPAPRAGGGGGQAAAQPETFQVGGYVPDATRPAPCWSAWPTRVGPAAPPCLQRPQPIL